jgi:hypothetical protein
MTRLRTAEQLDSRHLVAPLILMDVPARLRCPVCSSEFGSELVASLDTVVKCVACGTWFEFRQLHEAWCKARRFIIARAFPELDFSEPSFSNGREALVC